MIMAEHLILQKMSMAELERALDRQNIVLNSGVSKKLKDKGAALEKTRNMLISEIEYRKNLAFIESSMSNLTIRTPSEIEADEHTKKLCRMERGEKERFKPFCTLRTTKTVRADSPALKTMDVGPVNTKPAQMLNLSDSIDLQVQQEERVKEGQVKSKQERALSKSEQEEQNEAEKSDEEQGEEESSSGSDDSVATVIPALGPDRSDGEETGDK